MSIFPFIRAHQYWTRDNIRSLAKGSYQSYRAELEQCKNDALMDLEERHNQRELAIMENIEHYVVTKSCLEQAMTYSEQLVSNCSGTDQQQLEVKVVDRIKNLLEQLDRKPAGLQTSLEWDSENSAAAVRQVLPDCGDPQHRGHRNLPQPGCH